MPKQEVRTAIFPVAGLGTRFLPATKGTPKELLPVIDKPLIQYAINEAREARVERMVFVSHPTKAAIKHYVMDDEDLRAALKAHGKARLAQELEEAALDEKACELVFVMQNEPLGLGHAVLCAKDHVLPGPVAVILPDDLILGTPGCLSSMIAQYADCAAGHLVGAMKVPAELTSRYGILSVASEDGQILYADAVVEKPPTGQAPSRMAVVGRYILDASIFSDLQTQTLGADGEIQLTDAIARGIDRVGLAGFRIPGLRFDCGSKTGMLEATLYVASKDPAYAAVLDAYCNKRQLAAFDK